MTRLCAGILAAILLGACGGSDPAPTAPTSNTAAIGGVWRGTATTTSLFGGECLAPIFSVIIGTSGPISTTVTQNGAAVTATVISPSSGASCSYSGTMGQSALAMTGTTCTASDLFGVRCANGALRDVRLQTSSVSATVTGGSMSGTQGETYNVFVAGTNSGVGTLSINNSFSMTKQ